MIRILIFLLVVFCLGLGFAWLADRPGDMVITFSGYQYQISLMVAAVAGVAVVALVMISWWILKSIWNSPRAVNRYFRARRRDRGYQSLSTGLIAAGSGDSGLARKMGKQVSGLLSSDQEPLLHLLDAQTMLLEGRHDDARVKFEQMLDDPETRLLGLRGLYLEAQRTGERGAARHYAEQAANAAPQLIWASNAAIEMRTTEGDWAGALSLVESQSSAKQISKDEANQRRAVLLTARSMDVFDTDPATSRSAALEANKLMPDFVPAAVAAGRILYRQNEIRKGTKLLEAIWKKKPHPEVADIYVHARPGDSTHDRLKRARRLESLKRGHVESSLVVARAANDAGEYRIAREALEAALKSEPRESAYLLLADIEENETGDQGRVRHWLSKAVRAPRDPAWTADGYVSEKWAPVSPITGALGAFEWKVPVEHLGAVIEAEQPDEEADIPVIPPPVTEVVPVESTETPEVAENDNDDTGATDKTVEETEPSDAPVEEAATSDEQPDEAVATEEQVDEEVAAADEAPQEMMDGDAKADEDTTDVKAAAEPEDATTEPDEVAEDSEKTDAPDETSDETETDEPEPVRFQRMPDDPGVDEDAADKEEPRRFRLF